jgi:putative membrane protein
LGSEAIIEEFAQRQIIWNYALGESLRKLPFSDRVQDYLIDHRIAATNIPNALLDEHSLQLKQLADKGLISEFRLVQLNENLARLCDSIENVKESRIQYFHVLTAFWYIALSMCLLPFCHLDSTILSFLC